MTGAISRRATPKLSAGVVAVLGIVVIVLTAALFPPQRGATGDRLIELVDDELTDRGLAEHRFDLETWDAGFRQLHDEVVPWLASTARLDPVQFDSALRAEVAAYDAASGRLPAALPFARKIVDNLERQQGNFRAAQQLPAPGISLAVGGWMLIVCGALLTVLGASAMVIDRIWPSATICCVALALVAGPLLTGFIGKADRAADLIATLNFDRQVAQQTRDFFETTNELFASVDTQLLPASAVSLGTDRTRLVAATHARFPALAAAIDNRAAISDRFEARVRIRENAVEDLAGIKRVPLRSLGWIVLAVGATALIAGIGGLVSRGRAEPRHNENLGFG